MKKGLRKGLMLIIAVMALSVCFVFGVSALDETGQCGDNVYWSFYDSTGELIINGEGDMWDYSYDNNRSSFGFSVESVVIENGVTSIGDDTFYNCDNLRNITIPDSVTNIGDDAFYGCYDLQKVYIKNLEVWYSIHFESSKSNPLSNGAYLYLDGALVRELVIPDGTVNVGNAFEGCGSLTSVIIPDSVRIIGDSAFRYCDNLASIKIGNGVTSIGAYAFQGCCNLSNIVIPANVTSIGEWAFEGCESLRSVTISNKVTNIYSYAFYGCNSLINVYFLGTEEQWNAVKIDKGNSDLLDANIYFECNNIEEPDEPATEPDKPDAPSDDCSCNCHKDGFMGAIWKILRFFYKLFKTNQYCACGAAHY